LTIARLDITSDLPERKSSRPKSADCVRGDPASLERGAATADSGMENVTHLGVQIPDEFILGLDVL
jgi:hypothetical protein